jgi:hypothetical protein
VSGAGAQTHWPNTDDFDLELRNVELSPSVRPASIIPVALTWQAHTPLPHDYKVFVHAFDANGALVAQHDAQPLNDLRPMTAFPVGEEVIDHHGLALPPNFTGRLRIVAGIYDPVTGARIPNTQEQEMVELGTVEVGR